MRLEESKLERRYQFELHFHTAETSPCGNVPAEEGVALYQQQGYDGIVVTDHFNADIEGKQGELEWDAAVDRLLEGYRLARKTGDQLGISVFLGAEIKFPNDYCNEYLLYGITEAFLRKNEWLYEKDLKQLYALAEDNGILVVQAHPFRGWCERADTRYLHGGEAYNGHPWHDSKNDLAAEWVKAHDLIPTAGSDFHDISALAAAPVCFDRMPGDITELTVLLREGCYTMPSCG